MLSAPAVGSPDNPAPTARAAPAHRVSGSGASVLHEVASCTRGPVRHPRGRRSRMLSTQRHCAPQERCPSARCFTRDMRNLCRCKDGMPHSGKPLKLRAFTAARLVGRKRSCLRLTTLCVTCTIKRLIFKDCACRAWLTVRKAWRYSQPNRVGGELTLAALPHHRTCGSAYGGSCLLRQQRSELRFVPRVACRSCANTPAAIETSGLYSTRSRLTFTGDFCSDRFRDHA